MSTTALMNRWLRDRYSFVEDDQYSLASRMDRYAMPQTDEQSALIADILYHTFGDNAGAMLDQVDRYAIGWNESLHARAQDGKFTDGGQSKKARKAARKEARHGLGPTGKGGRSGAQFLDISGKPSNISRHYDPQQVAAKRQAVDQQRPTEDQFLERAAEQFQAAGGDTKTRSVQATLAKLEAKRSKLGEKAEAKRAVIAAKVFPDQKEAAKLEAKKDKLRAAVEQKKAARQQKLQSNIESETQAIFNEYQGRLDKAESDHLKGNSELRNTYGEDDDLQKYLQEAEQYFADEVEEIEQERDEFVEETTSGLRDALNDDVEELDGDLENELDDIDGEIEYFLEAAEKSRADAIEESNEDIEYEDADLEHEIEQFQTRLQELTDDAISDLSDQLQEAESEQFAPIEERQYDEDQEIEYRAETRQAENETLQQQFADMSADWKFGDREWQDEEAEFLQRARQLMAARMKEDRSLTQQHANYFLQVARERYAAKFDELKIKRDSGGRFAKKNESVAAIHDAIKTALTGGQHSPESVQGLADNLSQLTVRELTDLKKQYGIAAAGRSKADLVAKVADRLSRGRREAEQQQPEPEPDVYAPESLFSLNQGLVNALASKMGDRHQQDELRQVGRIALWKASQQWKPDSGTKFSTFAYTGIAQAIKNAQRTEGRQKSKAQEFSVDEEGGDQSQQVPGRDAAPDEDMEKQEQLGQLQDAMQQLQAKSPDAAKMVMMKYSGKKLSEIAAEFGITEQGASQAVKRAVERLGVIMGADKMQRTGDMVRYIDAWIRERYGFEKHDEQAELIADIIAHIYGDDAADILDAPDQYSLPQQMDLWILERYGRQFEESQVKRDEKGRFATQARNVEASHTAIQKALTGAKTPQSARELAELLSGLRVSDLHDIRRQYGISASGRLKTDLVNKIADRLDRGRRIEETPDEETEVAAEDERRSVDSGPDGGSVGGSVGAKPGRILTDRADLTAAATAEQLAKVPERLREHMTEHQQEGAAKAIDSLDQHGGFLLADGTGVGKTRQILAVADKYAAEGKKVVIVAPAEVISPNWKKGEAAGSYGKDSAAMGIETSLQKGDSPLKSGAITLTTYNELGKLKDQVDSNTVVLFDESHALKNSSSQRGKNGRDVSFNAGAVMYATATPADKPLHIAHLIRAGVFGNKSDTAKKFFGKAEDTYRELGLTKKTVWNKYAGREISTWQVDPRVGAAEVMRRVGGLFDQMTKEGLMLQRSLSMDNVTAISETVDLSDAATEAINNRFEQVMSDTDGNKAVALMAMRRAQEPFKIAATVDHVKAELAAGRQPIVFLGRVNDADDDGDDDKPAIDENTARRLKEALLEAGVAAADIGEMHGAATPTSAKKQSAMKKFNDGKTKVLISTIQSGGTGVNLDDTRGDSPRSIIMMTPPLTANDMVQAAGRINRMSTKSNARIINLVTNHPVDQWNMELLNKKMGTLGAVSSKPLEGLTGQEDSEQQQPFAWGRKLTESNNPPQRTAQPTAGQSAAKTGSEPATVTAKSGPTSATFAKLRDGSWGLRVIGPVQAGDAVKVKKKDGSSQTKKVKSVVKEFNDATLVSFYGMQPSDVEVERYFTPRHDEPLLRKLHRRQNHVNRKRKAIGEKLQPLSKEEDAIRNESLQLIDAIRKVDKLQSTIPRDRYSHLTPRGERIERLVGMMAAGFEQFVNMAGASGSGVPLLSQPPTPINPWNAAYADATNQDADKQLSRYSFKESDHPRDDGGKFAEKEGGGTGGSTDSFLAEFRQKQRKEAVSSTAAAIMDEYDSIVRDYAEENVDSYTDDEGAVDFQSLAADAIYDLSDGDAVKHAANMLLIDDPQAYQALTIEFGEHLKDHLDDQGLWDGKSQPNYDVEPTYAAEHMKEVAAKEYDAQADEMAASVWQEYGPDLTDWAEANISDYTDEDGSVDFETLAADAISDIDRDTRYGGLLDLLANLESDGNQMLIDRIDGFLRPRIADFDIDHYERKSSGWITLNAEDGEGTKVFLGEGGEVTAGPKGMTGKTLSGDKPKKSAGKQRDDSDDDPFNAPSRSEAATDADDDWRFEKQKIPWQARKVVDEIAERWGVSGDEMIPLAQEKLQTELANWETREAVKKHARKSLGLSSRVTSDMENSRSKRGEDFANLSGLDEFITEAQDMYPDFNWGEDPAQSLMEAVHEGAKPKPKLHDKAILDSAARYLFQTGQVAEAVPFSMLTHFPRTRYSRTVVFDSFCDEFIENALRSLTS